MSLSSRVVWSEGLFLRPHHFQQDARYIDRSLAAVFGQFSNGWGFSACEIDRDMLELGQIGMTRAQGFFPDGTRLDAPLHDSLPKPIQVDKESHGRRVFLCLPPRRHDGRDTSLSGLDTRRKTVVETVPDMSTEQGQKRADIEVSLLNPMLKIEGKIDAGIQGFVSIPIGKITDVASDGAIRLDTTFIPTVSNARKADVLAGFMTHTLGLLQGRAITLAERVSGLSSAGAAEVSDYILLQTINRYLSEFRQVVDASHVSPKELHQISVGLCSELAVHTQPERITIPFPTYDHRNLSAVFPPVMSEVRRSLSYIGDPTATNLVLSERDYGIRVTNVSDMTLLTNAQLVLSVGASLPGEDIRRRFPREAKIGNVDMIRDLVNIQLPGVRLKPLPTAPRQIPFHADRVYFQLERKGEYWNAIVESQALALHIGGNFPDLSLTLWAIREARR